MTVDARRALDGLLISPTPHSGRLGHAANRRMCAATYLDPTFRDRVLRDVYNDRSRRVAPSHGFDVVVVLRHAWRAWWLEVVQHLLVLTVLIIAAVCMFRETFIAGCTLGIWYVLRVMGSLTADLADYYSGKSGQFDILQLQARSKLLRCILLTLLGVLILVVVSASGTSGQSGVPAQPWLVRSGVAGAAVIVAAFAVIVAAAAAIRLAWVGRLHNDDARHVRRRGRRLRAIDMQQHHPFTVHSGFRPFIGSGKNARSWSFAQRLIPAKLIDLEPNQEYDVPPFTAKELISHLKEMISALSEDEHPETRLPGLTVTDHVFVEGTNAAPFLQALLNSRESTAVQEAIVAAIANPSDVARHYLACRVESWGGEVVTSVFVHVSLQGRTLYLEFSTYALLPTRSEYHVVDEAGGTGTRAVLKAAGNGLLHLPEQLVATRQLASGPVQLWAALRSGKDQTSKMSSRIDIGATVSARESAATATDESYFQYQDIRQHSKIIERRLIATVGDYLKELGVDTSEFWERATAILNNGVINTGPGTVNIARSAIGDQATVTAQTGSPASQADATPTA